MARIDTNQSDVLNAVVLFLRDTFSLTESTCYEVLSAADPPEHWVGSEDNWQLLVSCGPGQFDAGAFEGGGDSVLIEQWQIVVGIYTRIHLDYSGHDKHSLTLASRGILRLKKNVLDAVANVDLTTAGAASTDEDTDTVFLRETIRPVYASQPVYMEPLSRDGSEPGPGVVQMLIGFSMPFDWEGGSF